VELVFANSACQQVMLLNVEELDKSFRKGIWGTGMMPDLLHAPVGRFKYHRLLVVQQVQFHI
jgi:hypothetical protein